MIFLFMTIFVSRQLRVTLDSIHNSCNVSIQMCNFIENILETRNKKCVGKRRLQQKVFHSSFKMGSLFRSLHHQLAPQCIPAHFQTHDDFHCDDYESHVDKNDDVSVISVLAT